MKPTKIKAYAILTDDGTDICVHQTGKNYALSIFRTKKGAKEENFDPEYHKIVEVEIKIK